MTREELAMTYYKWYKEEQMGWNGCGSTMFVVCMAALVLFLIL